MSRETQRQQAYKNKDTKRKSQPLTPIAKAKSKECLNPSQINTEPYTEHLFNSVPFTSNIFYGSHQKSCKTYQKTKKIVSRNRASIRTRLRYGKDVGMIRQKKTLKQQ